MEGDVLLEGLECPCTSALYKGLLSLVFIYFLRVQQCTKVLGLAEWFNVWKRR
jgi:hypothetical protein